MRDPFQRLVSCYLDKFRKGNVHYSVKMTGNGASVRPSHAE